MSFNSNQCPVCKGDKKTTAFVCGPNVSGIQELDCKACEGKGWLDDGEIAVFNLQKAKHQQRRAHRQAQDLSMREMAAKLNVPFLRYNDYEHGRIDLPEIATQ